MGMARRVTEEVTGACAILGSLFLGLCLYSYDQWDPSFFTYTDAPAKNIVGIVGAYLADLMAGTLGVSSIAIPVFLMVYGVNVAFGREQQKVHAFGAVLFLFAGSLWGALVAGSMGMRFDVGGIVGRVSAGLLKAGLSQVGAYIVALAAMISAIIMLSPVSLLQLFINFRNREVVHAKEVQEQLFEDHELPVAAEPETDFEDDEYELSVPTNPPVDLDAQPLPLPLEPFEPSRRPPPPSGSDYVLPPLDFLRKYDPVKLASKEEIKERSALLEAKLEDFGVQGRIVQFHAGPVVTMYEFEPAPGVKINRIVSLSDDLALALKARSIRISTVPGKSTIGIEIPNDKPEIVSLREMLSSDAFDRSSSMLTFALGKDIFGNPVVADLARMPHLLVAGATGSGKSVSINTMVMSLLYRARPDEVKMLMIDPKLIELSVYDGIPHLIAPVVTNPKEATEMLRRMVFEMERRYRLIAEKGVRNIDSFNAEASAEERLPYIVVFIDELADLMYASASTVEESIARLAQMARASGIHLVLATQRPSVDVITGLIKANFPARIAFAVTSRIDSRTIIDTQGAEHLIGRGDMLFMLPGVKLLRVHGALVTEGEVKNVVDFVKAQGQPDYGIMEQIAVAEQEATEIAEADGDRDELYNKAIQLGESTGEVSISSIQRRLKIGYNRAARIMELMEEDGLVGPPKAAGKPRDYIGRRL